MKDNLESFIQENRFDFDTHEPSDRVWAGIQANISEQEKKRINWKKVVMNVAAAALIFMSSYGVFEYVHAKRSMGDINKLALRLKEQAPQLYEAEVYYTSKVNSTMGQLGAVLEEYPDIANELKIELAQIDSLNQSLIVDLKDNIANQEIIENLIMNYRIKLQILEEMLQEMSAMQSSNEEKSTGYEL